MNIKLVAKYIAYMILAIILIPLCKFWYLSFNDDLIVGWIATWSIFYVCLPMQIMCGINQFNMKDSSFKIFVYMSIVWGILILPHIFYLLAPKYFSFIMS